MDDYLVAIHDKWLDLDQRKFDCFMRGDRGRFEELTQRQMGLEEAVRVYVQYRGLDNAQTVKYMIAFKNNNKLHLEYR